MNGQHDADVTTPVSVDGVVTIRPLEVDIRQSSAKLKGPYAGTLGPFGNQTT